MVLQKAGYEVTALKCYAEVDALTKTGFDHFTAVITDHSLKEEKNGLDIRELIHGLSPDMPIILYTADDIQQLVGDGVMRVGFARVMVKNGLFTHNQIPAVLEEVLAERAHPLFPKDYAKAHPEAVRDALARNLVGVDYK